MIHVPQCLLEQAAPKEPNSIHSMNRVSRFFALLSLSTIILGGGGCADLSGTSSDSLVSPKHGSEYDRLWQESDEKWHRQNYGY
jgi:hypothetical protein